MHRYCFVESENKPCPLSGEIQHSAALARVLQESLFEDGILNMTEALRAAVNKASVCERAD